MLYDHTVLSDPTLPITVINKSNCYLIKLGLNAEFDPEKSQNIGKN